MRKSLLVASLVLVVFCPSVPAAVVRTLGLAQNNASLFSHPDSPIIEHLLPAHDYGIWEYDDARTFEQAVTSTQATANSLSVTHWVESTSKLAGILNHTSAINTTDTRFRIDPSAGESVGDLVDMYLHVVGVYPVGPTSTSNASVLGQLSPQGELGVGGSFPFYGTFKFSTPIGAEFILRGQSEVETTFRNATRRNAVTYQLSFSSAQPSAPPAQIPEPSTVTLGLLGAVVACGLAVHRRRSRSTSR